MIRAHVIAVKTLLTSGSVIPVYDAKVPDDAVLPYRVIYADDGLASVASLAGSSSWRDWQFQTTAVGSTPDNARLAAEANQAALLDARPTVAGRTCGPIRHETSRPIERDDDVTPPRFYAVDVWRFPSVPA